MNKNISSKYVENESSDDLLYKCWGHQDCWDCLSIGPCSWCPVSSTCVPNVTPMQILAPILNSDICPLWSERWELRARPFGCHVSTITFLTFLGSIYGTLLAMGLVILIMKCMGNGESNRGWFEVWGRYPRKLWRRKHSVVVQENPSPESRPLLGHVWFKPSSANRLWRLWIHDPNINPVAVHLKLFAQLGGLQDVLGFLTTARPPPPTPAKKSPENLFGFSVQYPSQFFPSLLFHYFKSDQSLTSYRTFPPKLALANTHIHSRLSSHCPLTSS